MGTGGFSYVGIDVTLNARLFFLSRKRLSLSLTIKGNNSIFPKVARSPGHLQEDATKRITLSFVLTPYLLHPLLHCLALIFLPMVPANLEDAEGQQFRHSWEVLAAMTAVYC